MSRRAVALAVVNLGCEMLYVIDERLMAQQVDKEKARKGVRSPKPDHGRPDHGRGS
jgi:hypothetical protein